MSIIQSKLKGTGETLFLVGVSGGAAGSGVANNSGVVELQSSAAALVTARAARIAATGTTINDLVSLLDLRGRIADIEYSFDGASAPTVGNNSGKFGFCHTTGGSYTAGEVVYDPGSVALLKIPSEVAKTITTRTAVTGTISLNANGIYVNQGGSWTLKGDGTASGAKPPIALAFDYEDTTVTSTTSIASGDIVSRVIVRVDTNFSTGTAPTIAVATDGSTPLTLMGTGESNLAVAMQYDNEIIADIASINAGHVVLTVTAGGASAGTGKVFVFFDTPTA